ncbi:MAG: multidrug efflux pump subunit AcrB [Gammaproteobacteria bacterium]|jgi:multidrug efflux pump subunit AcrB
MQSENRSDVLGVFTNHPVAANLLMVMMVLAGFWGLNNLNTQFFPTFNLDFVSVRVAWTGASAEDVEQLITTPLEQELSNVDSVKQLTSTSSDGRASITLEFEEGTDMSLAVDQVKEKVGLVRNLPATAETPEINRVVRYEPVAKVVISGSQTLRELRQIAYRFEKELLDKGIARIAISGLPEEEIAIQIPAETHKELGLSLADIGQRIAAASIDAPVGLIGRDEVARQLRFVDQRRSDLAFADLPVRVSDSGQRTTVGDIAVIERRPRDQQVSVRFRGKPAVEMQLSRAETSDSLKAANILSEWAAETKASLPPGVEVYTYDENWKLIKGRIMLLVKNGATGLLLVVLILFLFLSGRIAFWVTIGIPVSFMATLGILYLIGASINMVSLFGLIMALGIIVDDAIVVGEDAESHFKSGESSLDAAEMGARRMFAPVMSSSLTTIAAFLPLLLVGGIIGNILHAIPVVVICVIIASLIESFLVLPGHMRGSFRHMKRHAAGGVRGFLDRGFDCFKEGIFRPTVKAAVTYRWISLALAFALMILTVGWMAGGRIAFTFFPVAESTTLYANVSFVAGTPASKVRGYLDHMAKELDSTEASLGGDLLVAAVVRHGTIFIPGGRGSVRGDQYGSVVVELTEPDQRTVRNRQFIADWRNRLKPLSGMENLTVTERRGGPPGRDIDIRITGATTAAVKGAAQELRQLLSSVPGVSGIDDDLPFGREQLVLSLTPTAQALGLTVQEVSRQLRAAYDGYLVQILADNQDDVEVRVVLPDSERNHLDSLDTMEIILRGGNSVPVSNVVNIKTRRGFDSIRHADGKLAVTVTGDVDSAVNNANVILESFREKNLQQLSDSWGVKFSLEGRQADQQETIGDMKRGAILALIMIYLVLAWVFGSYGWPIVVMFIIPFGLIGAFWGHVLMGLDLTLLSLFGFFGLAGIVVNDSIILVMFYKELKQSDNGLSTFDAIIEAACRRLRAVLLTSLTTIGGLIPLLFETSLQAQFLIPMATSIAFGLAFSTLLVLLLVPSLLYLHEQIVELFTEQPTETNAIAANS